MENRGRVLSVDFSNAVGRTVKASPLTAIDYGQILEIHGLPLPPSFECHFSKNGATAYKSIGTTEDGVGTVPFIDEQTQSGGIITAYIYLHETADDGETEYRIIIPVESRPGVTPAEPTPVEQDVIAQAISALNNAVTTTTANVGITETNKNASAQSASEAEADANRADTAWNGAVIAQNSAQASADVASTKATEASQSASTAHSEAQYAKSYSESAHTDAQSASASATSAQSSATSAQQSASLAQQYANTATAKASEAMQSAQSASTSAQTATQKAQDAQNSATQANTSATSASASAQSATASEASASASATSAQESAESAQASADRAEQEADRWYEFLPVDSASGSLAHFTDGANSVPVKSLSVSLEPIQSGSGDPSPDNVRPISGHTQVAVNRTDGNGGNLQSITIPLGDTVYGGTLDVTQGVLTVDGELEVFDKVAASNSISSGINHFGTSGSVGTVGEYTRVSFAVETDTDQNKYNRVSSSYGIKMCNMLRHNFAYNDASAHWYRNTVLYAFFPTSLVGSTVQSVKDYLISIKDTSPLAFWIPYKEPITINLTPQQMTTLLGVNNVWSDSGDVSVDYRADVQLYIQKMIANALNA